MGSLTITQFDKPSRPGGQPVFDASRNPRLNRPIPAITVLRIRRINNQGADSVDVAI